MGTTHYPRSPKLRLGGLAHLPRLLDKIRLRQGGTDEELLAWIQARAKPLSDEDIREWNERILHGGPKDDAGRQRFQDRLAGIAAKRGVPVSVLPTVTTWSEIIELDEGRL